MAQSDSRAGAEALAEQCAAIIRERLGQYLIGDEKLAQQAMRLLGERGLSLALYEGTDRAPVYRTITDMPAGRAVLRGAIIHPLDRPADDSAAELLARTGAAAALDRWRSDLALGVQAASAPGEDCFTDRGRGAGPRRRHAQWQRRYDLNLDDGWEFIGTLTLDALRQYLLEQPVKQGCSQHDIRRDEGLGAGSRRQALSSANDR